MAADEDKRVSKGEVKSKQADGLKKKGVRRVRVQRQITIDPEVLAQSETYIF